VGRHFIKQGGFYMEKEIYDLHINAGRLSGIENTCFNKKGNPKTGYLTEEDASKSAMALSQQYNKEMEAYPCAFCGKWHIGGKMPLEVLISFKK
jgi:hypothetical protein